MLKSCKPKNMALKTGDRFKGITEYRSEFMNLKEIN